MKVNIAEAKAQLSSLVQKALTGEEIVIARDNKPLVKLVPLEPFAGKRRPGSAKGQILYLAEDFDQLPADFNEYI